MDQNSLRNVRTEITPEFLDTVRDKHAREKGTVTQSMSILKLRIVRAIGIAALGFISAIPALSQEAKVYRSIAVMDFRFAGISWEEMESYVDRMSLKILETQGFRRVINRTQREELLRETGRVRRHGRVCSGLRSPGFYPGPFKQTTPDSAGERGKTPGAQGGCRFSAWAGRGYGGSRGRGGKLPLRGGVGRVQPDIRDQLEICRRSVSDLF